MGTGIDRHLGKHSPHSADRETEAKEVKHPNLGHVYLQVETGLGTASNFKSSILCRVAYPRCLRTRTWETSVGRKEGKKGERWEQRKKEEVCG